MWKARGQDPEGLLTQVLDAPGHEPATRYLRGTSGDLLYEHPWADAGSLRHLAVSFPAETAISCGYRARAPSLGDANGLPGGSGEDAIEVGARSQC